MLTRARTTAPRREGGYTFVELLVAMSLFSLLLVIVMAGIVGMSRLTVRAGNTADNADSARKAYQVLDQQVRSAAAINPEGTGADGSWFVELLVSPRPAGSPDAKIPDDYCVQWRLETGTGSLAYRSWPNTTAPTPTDWVPVAFHVVVPAAGAQAPLTMLPADATHGLQRLDVQLTVQKGATRASQVETVLVARNTSTTTKTNSRADGDRVCAQVTRS